MLLQHSAIVTDMLGVIKSRFYNRSQYAIVDLCYIKLKQECSAYGSSGNTKFSDGVLEGY